MELQNVNLKSTWTPDTAYNGMIVAVMIGGAALQGCSTTDTLTSAYGSVSPSAEVLQALGDDPASARAKARAYASRRSPSSFDYSSVYAARDDAGVSVSAFNYQKMSPKYLRQEVRYFGPESVGSIVVDARYRYLYLVQPDGMAIRYGIAVGKEGYGWTGSSILQWKQKWATWTPPAEMIARKPELKKYADGLKGSPANPLGARAMYLYKNGRDTLYRIHGTTKPFSIGKAASSGCFRMINQDVIDLYERVGEKRVAVHVRPQVAASFVSER